MLSGWRLLRWKTNRKGQMKQVTSWTLILPVTQMSQRRCSLKVEKLNLQCCSRGDESSRLCTAACWDCCASEQRESLMEALRVKTCERLAVMSCDCLSWRERTVNDPRLFCSSLLPPLRRTYTFTSLSIIIILLMDPLQPGCESFFVY